MFSNHSVARTESYAGGEVNVNVDVDDRNQVIGIEMLSIDAEEFAVLADVTARLFPQRGSAARHVSPLKSRLAKSSILTPESY